MAALKRQLEDSMRLSTDQIDEYYERGFIIVPHLIPEASLDRYEQRFKSFACGEVALEPQMKIMRDIMIVRGVVEPESPLHAINKMINFEDDPLLYGYTREPALTTAIRDLIGPEIYSVSTNIFNKPPGLDGRHPLHQDLRYFRIRPADKIVGTWTPFANTTRESGCLAAIPGSHTGELLDHADPDWEFVNAGFFGIQGVDGSNRIHLEMQRGDTLLFHPLLIHGSGQNVSGAFRRAISSHYASAECESPNRDWRIGKQARRIPED
jgi:phytanoyl-CoA hydroxylase